VTLTEEPRPFDSLDSDQLYAVDADVPDMRRLPADFWERPIRVVKSSGGRL
jgi:hypothetical protein